MKSILFSMFQHFRTLDLGDAIAETFRALRGIIRTLKRQSGDAKIITALKNIECEKCPFYDAKWKTCGTPGDTMEGPLSFKFKVGCWCYLPLANRDPKKDCYARANEIADTENQTPIGWPDALRPVKDDDV